MWRANSLEKILMLGKVEGRRRGQQRMRWLDGFIKSMDMSLSKLWDIVKDREAWPCCSSWGHKGLDTAKQLNNNWENHWSWSSYNYVKSCQRTQCWPFYGYSAFGANWKGENLSKWVPHELGTSWADWKSKKIIILKCRLLLDCATMNHFSIRLWHVMKSGFYVTTGND